MILTFHSIRGGLPAVALLLAVSGFAQELPIRRSSDLGREPLRIDLRARVDGSADFFVRGARIRFEALNGRPPTDEGSEYTAALPSETPVSLRVRKLDGRGRIVVTEQPTRANDWTLRLRISDPKGGDDRYHARITWDDGAAVSSSTVSSNTGSSNTGSSRAPSAPDVRVEELSASADGRGLLRTADRTENLSQASISLIAGGRAIVSFPGVRNSRLDGTWAYLAANRIGLTITKAMGLPATGSGELRMRGERFYRLDLRGSATGKGDFEVTFDQAGEYKDFVNRATPARSGGSAQGAAPPARTTSEIRAPRPGARRPGARPAPPPPPPPPARPADRENDEIHAPRPPGVRQPVRAPVRRAPAVRVPAVRIRDLNQKFRGTGYIDAERLQEDHLTEVLIRLRDDGRAILEFKGDRYWTLEGRWSHNGSETVTLGLTRIERSDASGGGTLRVLRKPGGEWTVERVEIDGESPDSGRVRVQMQLQ